MLLLTRSLLAQIAGIFDNYRPLLNQRAIDMQSRYAPEAFRQSRRYANAKRGQRAQLPRLCDRELLEIPTVKDFQALLLLLALS
ncbi:MAG: hypothetical protein F6K56_29925 [Moorea sp. SIO3G5]|nr:hypothetical protein [Moorena sp. SIO3G5]